MQPRKRITLCSLRLVRESSILYSARKVSTPTEAVSIFSEFLGDLDREAFMAIYLNTRNEPTCISMISQGTLNQSFVHPREVFKVGIVTNSASMIVAHNHPSGNATPSSQDIDVTRRLEEAGKLIGIEVLDSLIIGHNEFTSLKEKGLL